MGLSNNLWVKNLLYWVFLLFLCFEDGECNSSEISVNFTKAPLTITHLNSAEFEFEVLVGGDRNACSNCTIKCKLDEYMSFDCGARSVSYGNLQDGNHILEVCISGSAGVDCASFNWVVDTVPPTAYVSASAAFTNAMNVSVMITFSEPCTGGGGFACSSINTCNLLVYGAGQVVPSTITILQPDLKYSLLVGLSSEVQYGRVIIAMDKNFCTDSAGNRFIRTANSSFILRLDRRHALVNLRTMIHEKLLQLRGETRTVQATNNYGNLRLYLYFSEPVLNSSAEILASLNVSQGALHPISLESLGSRRFGVAVKNLSSTAIVTISLASNSIISREGSAVSAVAPITFLYDTQRPAVRLSTTSSQRTREHNIPLLIKFMKPVFGFKSSHILLSGAHLHSFAEVSASTYAAEIRAHEDVISVFIPENITGDVAGNKNLPSNILQVRHYSVPVVSSVASIVVGISIAGTLLAAGLLTVSTASLQSLGAFSRYHSFMTVDPTRNLFRLVCHIQVFALSRWLGVILPVEFHEFVRSLQWAIPYFSLPWEKIQSHPNLVGSGSPAFSRFTDSSSHEAVVFRSVRPNQENLEIASSAYALPLTPMEYRLFLYDQNMNPEALDIMDLQNSNGWRDFNRGMFWLAVICGALILSHAIILLMLKIKKHSSEKYRGYGPLTFPRFELFLIILALPCICQASFALIKGGAPSGVSVGSLIIGIVSLLMLGLFLFLSVGITFGKLLQYKEIHQEGQKFHWYQDIVRATLGPGKRGQWTWKNQTLTKYLIKLGPLFEDLRGPPKYMLSQISGESTRTPSDPIITSDDETEDAEAPCVQKLFGILRIYYTLLESVKRFCLGIMAGAHLKNSPSKTPTITLLSITSFQLFFLVLKKPFIKKRVQLVEIISVTSELGIFATCMVLLEEEYSDVDEAGVGIFMLILFLVGFSAQLINEFCALYRQTEHLDPVGNSFFSGLKTASMGLFLLVIPRCMTKNIERRFPLDHHEDGGPGNGILVGERCRMSGTRSSGTPDMPWMKQLRELAKASFSKGSEAVTGPSSSRTRWSGVGSGKRSGSSPPTSTSSKSKMKGLYSDLEAIFASK